MAEIVASTEEQLLQEMIVEGVSGLVNKKTGKLLDKVWLYKLADMKNVLKIFGVSMTEKDLDNIDGVLRGRNLLQ